MAYCVESVVDEMLEVFTHADLSHQFVLVAVHARQLAHVGKHVLQTVRQLKENNTFIITNCMPSDNSKREREPPIVVQ